MFQLCSMMAMKWAAFILFWLFIAAVLWCMPACGQVIEVAAFTVQPAAQPAKPALRKVVHRSGRNWTDPDIGRWTRETITRHLMGEIESPEHRGKVPLEQLQGRSLQELIAIHANLHEGYQWDGTPYPRKVSQIEQLEPYCPPGST